MKKRILSLLLALVMVLGMFPMSAMAVEGSYTFDTNMAAPTTTFINVKQVSLTGAQVRKANVSNNGFTWDVLLTSCEDSVGIALTLEATKSTYSNMAQVSLDGGKFTQGKKGAWSTTVTPDFENGDGKVSYTLTTRHLTNTKTERDFTLNFTLLANDYVNQAPALSGESSATAKILSGETYSLDLGTAFEDPDHDDSALTYTVKVDGGEAQTAAANYSYTADADYVGEKEFVFTAKDPEGLTSEDYTVTLNIARNTAPSVAEGAATTGEGMEALPWTLNLTTLFSDVDGDDMTFTVKENGGEAKAAEANYTYMPTTQGEHILVFQATDARGAASVEHTVTLTAAANPTPVLAEGVEANGTASGIIPFTYTIDLSTIFTDNEGDRLSYTVKINDAEPIDAAASYSYTPDVAGEHILAFYAEDRAGNTSPAYTVALTAVANPTPTLVEGIEATATASGIIPFTYTLNLSTIFADNEGDSLTYTVKIDEADAVSAGENYNYSPETVGEHTLVFQATDTSGGKSPLYTVTVNVLGNPAPTLAEGVDEGSAATAYQFFAWSTDISKFFADNEGDILTYTVKIGEADAVSANANYSYTFDTAGEQILVFQAADLDGSLSPTHTVTLNVKESFKETISTTCKGNGATGDTYVRAINITGSKIEGYIWNVESGHAEGSEHILHVRLAEGTEDNAPIALSYTPGYQISGFNGSVSGPSSVTLSEGKATVTVKTTGWMSQGIPRTYILHFTTEANLAPVVTDNALGSANVNTGEAFTLDLSEIFSEPNGEALTYTVQEGEGEAIATEAMFSKVIGSSGEHTFVFTATDPWGDSASHTVTVTAMLSEDTNALTVLVPEGITPVFSVTAGYDGNGIDIPGEVLTAVSGTVQNGLVPYTVAVPEGIDTVSVRAEGWGGMAFPAVADSTVALRKVQMNVLDFNNQPAENSSSVTYGDHAAAFGTNGLLLVVGAEYVFSAAPNDTANFVLTSETVTLEAGADIYVLDMMLDLKNPLTITVTTGAKAQLYKYNQYYSSTEFDAKKVQDNGDGTTTYSFIADTTGRDSFMYRVSMEGKIAKAGWLGWNQQSLTVLHTENDKANTWRLDDYSATGHSNSGVAEDSVLLNINGRNHLNLSVGQTKTLKAYRAWEIIKTSSDNQILTPDFTYTILSGSDVVSLTEKASPSTADGDWMTLTALQEGVAIIEVTYDALLVSGGGYAGIYGASDPYRSGLVVVTVGGSDESVNFGIDCFASIGTKGSANTTFNPNNKKAWDAEFDTLYFTGNSRELQFTPTASGEIQSVAMSNDKGATWTTLTAANGVYTATIVPGNNILRVTTAAGTAYQVVRGDKVGVKLAEVSGASDEDGIIEAGETIRVTLKGLHTPIPKMAGNYNPGFGGNNDGYSYQHLNYICNDELIYGPGTQYNFITAANYVEIEMPQDGSDVALTDGYIGVGVIGLTRFADGGDSHRNIPDNGCTTRGSTSTWHTRSILPEITVTIGEETAPNTAPAVRDGAPTTASLELSESVYTYAVNLATTVFTDPDTADTLTYSVKVNDGEAAPVENGYYTLARPEVGTYTLLFTVSDGKASAEHTITLTVTKAEAPAPDPTPGGGDEGEQVVYVSFVDFAVRVEGESGVDYPNQLGTIVPTTAVSFSQGDTIADVTLRLLDSKGMTYQYTGTPKSGFYLSKIGNFSANGIPVDEFGEFDAGNGSGWMITQNGTFIGQGASEFLVKDGDVIEWKYTCRLGADIGDPYWDDKEYGGSVNGDQDETALNFTDVSENDYYYDAVKWAVEKGITNGIGDAAFGPHAACTRAQMVTFLWRAAGEPKAKSTTCIFTDVDKNAYYYDALLWAVENGITSGTSAATFSPEADCSRGQMAAFLYRNAKTPSVSGSHDFADVKADAYYNDAVIWAAEKGITKGTGAAAFSPDAACTRAQMVTFLYRYLAK